MQLQLVSDSPVNMVKNSSDNRFREGSIQGDVELFLQRERKNMFLVESRS
jgi:hypothetical protein